MKTIFKTIMITINNIDRLRIIFILFSFSFWIFHPFPLRPVGFFLHPFLKKILLHCFYLFQVLLSYHVRVHHFLVMFWIVLVFLSPRLLLKILSLEVLLVVTACSSGRPDHVDQVVELNGGGARVEEWHEKEEEE